MRLSECPDDVDVLPETFVIPALRVFALERVALDGRLVTTYVTAHGYFVEAGNLIFKDLDATGRIWHRQTVPAGVWRDVQEVVTMLGMSVN